MWGFATANPGVSLLIVIVLALTICSLWMRAMRTLTIRKAGWPPPHLDADGDAISCGCEEDDDDQ